MLFTLYYIGRILVCGTPATERNKAYGYSHNEDERNGKHPPINRDSVSKLLQPSIHNPPRYGHSHHKAGADNLRITTIQEPQQSAGR